MPKPPRNHIQNPTPHQHSALLPGNIFPVRIQPPYSQIYDYVPEAHSPASPTLATTLEPGGAGRLKPLHYLERGESEPNVFLV